MTAKGGSVIKAVFTNGQERAFLVCVLAMAAEGFERQGRGDLAFANRAPCPAGGLDVEVAAAQREMKAKGEASITLAAAINDALMIDVEGKVVALDLGKVGKAIEVFVGLREIETRALALFRPLIEKAVAAMRCAGSA